MEFLALVYDNPDAWKRMSEAERSSAEEGYMAVARDAAAAERRFLERRLGETASGTPQ